MNEKLGGRIKALRDAKNLTQKQIADEVRIRRQKYVKIEKYEFLPE